MFAWPWVYGCLTLRVGGRCLLVLSSQVPLAFRGCLCGSQAQSRKAGCVWMSKVWSYSVKRWLCHSDEVHLCRVWKWGAMDASRMLRLGVDVRHIWTVPPCGCWRLYLPGGLSPLNTASFDEAAGSSSSCWLLQFSSVQRHQRGTS